MDVPLQNGGDKSVFRYVLKRVAMLIPLIIGITLVTFVLMNVIPGDATIGLMDPKRGQLDPEAAERLRERWGLNDPPYLQYFKFLRNSVRGDLGFSFRFNQPVTRVILERIPATLQLGAAALALAIIIAVPAGIICAVRQGGFIDTSIMALCVTGVSMPVFWLGLLLMYLFAVRLRLLPAAGFGTPAFFILPTLTLALSAVAMLSRITRSSMLEVLRQDYIRTARSKGLSEWIVICKHALRNALIPMVTVIGVQAGWLLTGAVITENVFGWPGVGRLLVDSIGQRDLPVVQGCVLIMVAVFAVVNLVVDILYIYIDPRIRLGGKGGH